MNGNPSPMWSGLVRAAAIQALLAQTKAVEAHREDNAVYLKQYLISSPLLVTGSYNQEDRAWVWSPGVWVLDHRLLPEVRAVLLAMVSRIPGGGIRQRYRELVAAAMEGMAAAGDEPDWLLAERSLTRYPLLPKVREFITKWVTDYGHSSIAELTGDPALVVEGVSWQVAWYLADTPLFAGIEASTRAVTHLAYKTAVDIPESPRDEEQLERLRQVLQALAPFPGGSISPKERTLDCVGEWQAHAEAVRESAWNWLGIWDKERAAWEAWAADSTNRAKLKSNDPQGFRVALDRARWALPGTFATTVGVAMRARDIDRHLGRLVASLTAASAQGGSTGSSGGWIPDHILLGQAAVLAGVHAVLSAQMTALVPPLFKEGVQVRHQQHAFALGHLMDLRGHKHRGIVFLGELGEQRQRLEDVRWNDLEARAVVHRGESRRGAARAEGLPGTYGPPEVVEPLCVVEMCVPLSVARDFHRHRPLHPMHVEVLYLTNDTNWEQRLSEVAEVGAGGLIAPQYDILTDLSPQACPGAESVLRWPGRGLCLPGGNRAPRNLWTGLLAQPLGLYVRLRFSGSASDIRYMAELRAHNKGGDAIYKHAAAVLLGSLSTDGIGANPYPAQDIRGVLVTNRREVRLTRRDVRMAAFPLTLRDVRGGATPYPGDLPEEEK